MPAVVTARRVLGKRHELLLPTKGDLTNSNARCRRAAIPEVEHEVLTSLHRQPERPGFQEETGPLEIFQLLRDEHSGRVVGRVGALRQRS